MGNELGRAEESLRRLLKEDVPDGLGVRIRATLGSLLARKGDHAEAVRQLEAVIASGGVRPGIRPDVYETLSRSYLAMNAPVMALKLLEGCIAAVDEDERYLTQQIRYRSFLATALAAMGGLERAKEVLDEATQRAERLGGFGERVSVHWERARLFWMKGDGDAALSAIAYARALAELAEDTLQIARAHLFSAQILNYDGRAEEAGPHLEKAERLLEFGEDAVDRGVLRAEQAKYRAKLGRANRHSRTPTKRPTCSPSTSGTPPTPGTRSARHNSAIWTPQMRSTGARSMPSASASSGAKRSTSPRTGQPPYARPAGTSAPSPCSNKRRHTGSGYAPHAGAYSRSDQGTVLPSWRPLLRAPGHTRVRARAWGWDF